MRLDLSRPASGFVSRFGAYGRTKIGKISLVDVAKAIGWNTDIHGDKFADPWIEQQASDPGFRIPTGASYLDSVPMDATARVDAILAYVTGPAGDVEVPGVEALEALGDALRQRIDAEALRTRQAVWSGWDAMVDAVGGKSNIYVLAAAGAMKWLTTTFDPGNYGASAKAKFEAADAISCMVEQIGIATSTITPYPWHLFQSMPLDTPKIAASFASMATKDPKTGKTTSDWKTSTSEFESGISDVIAETSTDKGVIQSLQHGCSVLTSNAQKFNALPQDMQDAARAWFGMLTAHLDDPFTRRVFNALPSGEWGAWGHSSDELVVLVAAGFGAGYGLDQAGVRDLAIALFDASPGWVDHLSLLSNLGYAPPGDYGAGSGGHADSPTNAAQVQLGDLCLRARAIVAPSGSTVGTVGTVAKVAGGLGALALLWWLL